MSNDKNVLCACLFVFCVTCLRVRVCSVCVCVRVCSKVCVLIGVCVCEFVFRLHASIVGELFSCFC